MVLCSRVVWWSQRSKVKCQPQPQSDNLYCCMCAIKHVIRISSSTNIPCNSHISCVVGVLAKINHVGQYFVLKYGKTKLFMWQERPWWITTMLLIYQWFTHKMTQPESHIRPYNIHTSLLTINYQNIFPNKCIKQPK